MKILLTGGCSGGHFYPIIAIAEQIKDIAREEKILSPELIFMAPDPYDKSALFENGIEFKQAAAGKIRRYFSIKNFFDVFKTGWGVVKATFSVFSIFPDVIFGKGCYGSFPALLAGRLFRIPVIIHESDTVPGRVNKWAGKFARRIAISFPDTASYFPNSEGKIALTGNPIRKELVHPSNAGAFEYLDLEEGVPVVFILGGSQGANLINETVLEALPRLVERYQVIHQTGEKHIGSVKETADVVLADNKNKDRYKPFGFLNKLAMRMSAGAADVVVSRSGSGALFEIAAWGLPSIIVPINESVSHNQKQNAFYYARTGAAEVIEEKNFTPSILASEIERIISNTKEAEKMSKAASDFAKPDAARKIAREIIALGLEH